MLAAAASNCLSWVDFWSDAAGSIWPGLPASLPAMPCAGLAGFETSLAPSMAAPWREAPLSSAELPPMMPPAPLCVAMVSGGMK